MNKPLGILIDGTMYNVNNISSFSDVTNKVTNMRFISISFIHPIDGNNGMSIKYDPKILTKLNDCFVGIRFANS